MSSNRRSPVGHACGGVAASLRNAQTVRLDNVVLIYLLNHQSQCLLELDCQLGLILGCDDVVFVAEWGNCITCDFDVQFVGVGGRLFLEFEPFANLLARGRKLGGTYTS